MTEGPPARGLAERLERAAAAGRLPGIRAYHRIDGPGSSLDLSEFQQALWRLPDAEERAQSDPSLAWSRRLARTVALTIDTGTHVRAEPYEPGRLAARSEDYDTEVSGFAGEIPPTAENWLLKCLEAFGLSGVRVVLRNLVPDTHSAGLGGSATATTGTCLLANALAGEPLGPVQLVAMASRLERDLGVSLTGTQEQSNVVFGGVVDYLWCPWGAPGEPGTGFGSSVRSTLLGPDAYSEIERRMAIFHTGRERTSSRTNAVWVEALLDPSARGLIHQKLDAAYAYREGLRRRDWTAVRDAIRSYRDARTRLCPEYMTAAEELHATAEAAGGAVFPLGAGGGGGVLVFCEDPSRLTALRDELRERYREIPFRIRSSGHERVHLD